MPKETIEFTHNGSPKTVSLDVGASMLDVLRRDVGDVTPKYGCGQGTCGACTIIVDGAPKLACLLLAQTCDGVKIETVAGMHTGPDLHPLQTAFMDRFAAQCGYCTPGMLMSAKALLDKNPNASRDEIVEAIGGNICRCTGYESIVDAIEDVARGRNASDGALVTGTRNGDVG